MSFFTDAEQEWIDAGGPSYLAPVMAAIASAESSSGTNLYGDYENGQPTSIGWWQIHNVNWATLGVNEQELLDPATNAWAAVQIWKRQGLGAWTTFTNGAYKKYLSGGSNATQTANVPGVSNNTGTTTAPVSDWSDAAKTLAVVSAVIILGYFMYHAYTG